MSHASTKEFPGNKSHHFRKRLPKPIRFMGRGWMVGMVSLSLPTIPVVVEEGGVGDSHPLLYVRWHERVYAQDDQGNDRWWHQRRELTVYGRDMRKQLLSSMGSHFFHQLVYRYVQARAKQTEPLNKWAEDNGVKLYPTFEWTSEGDLVLNTVNVDYKVQVAHVSWGRTLALKMGWIEQVSTGVYRLGPNILQEFHSDSIPTPTDVRDAGNKPLFWKVEGEYLKLSMTCNWRFVNLNNAFRPSTEFPSARPLHVYCDVGTSSMVGVASPISYEKSSTNHKTPRTLNLDIFNMSRYAMKWWKSWKPR